MRKWTRPGRVVTKYVTSGPVTAAKQLAPGGNPFGNQPVERFVAGTDQATLTVGDASSSSPAGESGAFHPSPKITPAIWLAASASLPVERCV